MMALKYTTMLNRKAWQAQAFERLHDIKISTAVEESKEVLLPPKKKAQPQSKESYAAACKRRSRCSHKKEEDDESVGSSGGSEPIFVFRKPSSGGAEPTGGRGDAPDADVLAQLMGDW